MPSAPLRPAPPPEQINLRRLVYAGTALFGVAAIVLAVLPWSREPGNGVWVWTAVSGAFLGLLGLVVMRWQKAP